MISTDTVRKLLAVADVAKDPYAVAAGAASLIGQGAATDAPATQHYLRALSALRLSAAGFRLLNTPAPPGATGLIPWTSRARRFAANLKALERRYPDSAAQVAQAAAELQHYELFQAVDGNYQVLDTCLPVTTAWLGGLADHKAAALVWQYDSAQVPMPFPVACDGLAFGWPLLRILETTADSFLDYSCAVHIVECEPHVAAMVLHLHDLQETIAAPRTHWSINITPEAAVNDFRQELATHPEYSLPAQFVRCLLKPRPALDLETTVNELRTAREKHHAQQREVIRAYYADKNAAAWAQRFAQAAHGAAPLRVLGITSRYTTVLQHSMAELKAAAQQTGAAMEVAIEPSPHSLENPYLDLIATHKPDLIIQLSRMRYENPHLPRNVPFLTWDQDNLACMRTPQATASLDALTLVAGHGAVFGYTTLNWPRQNCIFTHAAAATLRYHAAPAPPELLKKHACDISFVSNASGTPESLAEKLRQRWKESPFAAFFDDMIALVLSKTTEGGDQTWDFVALRNLARSRAAAQNLPLDPRLLNELTMDLNTYSDRAYRHTALAWVSRWCEQNGKTLRLYGNGWETHPTLAKCAFGRLTPGEDARAVFQATKINLQLLQPGFVHSRALDGLAAGGFFLARETQADGIGSAEIATLYQLAKWVTDHNITTDAQLDAIDDPNIRVMTAATRAYYLRHEVTEPLCPSLHIWAHMPASGILFPQLGKIVFRNETEFATLADHYLSNPAERAILAAEMRDIVEKQFSYRARFETFLAGIRSSLENPAATSTARETSSCP